MVNKGEPSLNYWSNYDLCDSMGAILNRRQCGIMVELHDFYNTTDLGLLGKQIRSIVQLLVRQDLYDAMAAFLHEIKGGPLLESWSKNYLYNAMRASLHGKNK